MPNWLALAVEAAGPMTKAAPGMEHMVKAIVAEIRSDDHASAKALAIAEDLEAGLDDIVHAVTQNTSEAQ